MISSRSHISKLHARVRSWRISAVCGRIRDGRFPPDRRVKPLIKVDRARSTCGAASQASRHPPPARRRRQRSRTVEFLRSSRIGRRIGACCSGRTATQSLGLRYGRNPSHAAAIALARKFLVRLLPRQLDAACRTGRLLVLHDQFIAAESDEPFHIGTSDAAGVAGVDMHRQRAFGVVDRVVPK